MNRWLNLLFLGGGVIFILLVAFGIYLFFKVYTIRDIVYCVYDDRDVYENTAIGSLDECTEWIEAIDGSEDEKNHFHVTLYFDWSFKINRKRL